MSLVASSTSKSNASAKASSKSCTPSSHSGKSPPLMASHRSRRWKSGSAPLIFTASFHTTDCMPSFGFQWNFTNVDAPAAFDEPERVHAEALHEPERAGDRPVRHRPHHHVGRLRHQRDEVPEVVVRRLRLREAAVGRLLHGVDDVGELDGVLDEEDRDVVADEVPVALLRVELDGEAADVASEVERALVPGHGREPDEHRRVLAGPLEQVGPGHVGQRLVGLEEAVRAEAAGVHDALGDPLVVEVEDLLPEVEVLEQRRAALAGAQRVLVVGDRHALLRREAGTRGDLMGLAARPRLAREVADGHAVVGGGRGGIRRRRRPARFDGRVPVGAAFAAALTRAGGAFLAAMRGASSEWTGSATRSAAPAGVATRCDRRATPLPAAAGARPLVSARGAGTWRRGRSGPAAAARTGSAPASARPPARPRCARQQHPEPGGVDEAHRGEVHDGHRRVGERGLQRRRGRQVDITDDGERRGADGADTERVWFVGAHRKGRTGEQRDAPSMIPRVGRIHHPWGWLRSRCGIAITGSGAPRPRRRLRGRAHRRGQHVRALPRPHHGRRARRQRADPRRRRRRPVRHVRPGRGRRRQPRRADLERARRQGRRVHVELPPAARGDGAAATARPGTCPRR